MSASQFKYFAIFGAMRTGSNLLERNLNQYDDLECHGELFNPDFLGKPGREDFHGITLAAREENPHWLIDKMITSSGEKIPGFRIFRDHDRRIIKSAIEDPTCAKIILSRAPLDSFISLKIARKTNQWLLGNAPKRKCAVVDFDLAEFSQYLTDLSTYQASLQNALQMNGQTAFHINYDDLKSVAIMNGLARYLGSQQVKTGFAEPIKRQNPEPLSEKVSNYDQMIHDLGALGADNLEIAQIRQSDKGLGIRDLVVSDHAPLLFLPIPGVETAHIYDWLAQIDNKVDQTLRSGLNQKDLNNWLEGAEDLISFAVVDHPLERAYRVFMRHIFPGAIAEFPKIRRRLCAHFGLVLPEENQDWSVDQHRSAFESFLCFLKSNIAGQTSIRIDRNWDAQHKLIAAVAETQPISRIFRADEFSADALGIETPLKDPALTITSPFSLEEIYSRRLENLARAAYAKDYRMFGFKDWASSGL